MHCLCLHATTLIFINFLCGLESGFISEVGEYETKSLQYANMNLKIMQNIFTNPQWSEISEKTKHKANQCTQRARNHDKTIVGKTH